MSNPRIGVALFGMGRAGTIHFLNLVKNPRVEILYIMERGRSEQGMVHDFLICL